MYLQILSIFGRICFIKFNNTLVLPDPEPPIIKILKACSECKPNFGCDLVLIEKGIMEMNVWV